MTAWAKGYESAYWLTYNQAKLQDGQVRKGEKSSLVIFWKRYVTKDKETGDKKIVPVIRHYLEVAISLLVDTTVRFITSSDDLYMPILQ